MILRASHEITLVASTLDHINKEFESTEALALKLGAAVSNNWPPGEYDLDALTFFRERFETEGKAAEGWYGWYAVRDALGDNPRTLVGAGGYFGPPDEDGSVEIGYSILPEWQRRGYASTLVSALVANAFAIAQVNRVIAHTTDANRASIGVLQRCFFARIGPGREPGLVRFERCRECLDR